MAVVQLERTLGSRRFEAALQKMRDGVQAMAAWVQEARGEDLGEGLIQIRESGIDPLEAAFAGGVRRFDKSGEYKADGMLSVTDWLKWKCKLSGGAAAEPGADRAAARAAAPDRGGVRARRPGLPTCGADRPDRRPRGRG